MKKLLLCVIAALCLCACTENYVIDHSGIVVGIFTDYQCITIINPNTKYKVRVEVNYSSDNATNYYVLYTDRKYAIGDTISFH